MPCVFWSFNGVCGAGKVQPIIPSRLYTHSNSRQLSRTKFIPLYDAFECVSTGVRILLSL